MNFGKLGFFAGGALFGTAGIAVLASKEAKKVYTQCTAVVLRAKDSVMKTTAALKENCGDIYASAKDINEKRYDEQAAQRLAEAKAVVAEYEGGKD